MMGYPAGMAPQRGVPATPQESGGTTYYCPTQPHHGAPTMAPAPASVTPVTPTALHPYPGAPVTAGTSTAYPQSVAQSVAQLVTQSG